MERLRQDIQSQPVRQCLGHLPALGDRTVWLRLVLGYALLNDGQEFNVIHFKGRIILGKTHKFGIAVKVPAQRLEEVH